MGIGVRHTRLVHVPSERFGPVDCEYAPLTNPKARAPESAAIFNMIYPLVGDAKPTKYWQATFRENVLKPSRLRCGKTGNGLAEIFVGRVFGFLVVRQSDL